MRAIHMITAAFAALFLTGCSIDPSGIDPNDRQANYTAGESVVLRYAGQGACLDCFNIYRGRNDQKAFALSPSGAFGVAWEQESRADAQQAALRQCRSSNGNEANQPCRLLMDGDRYVWRD